MKIVILTLVLISRSSFIKVRQQEKETSTLLRQKMKNTKDKKLKMLINQLKVEDLIIYIHQFRRLTFRSLFLLRLMKPVGTGTLILILEWSYSLQFCNFCSTWATKTIEMHGLKSVQIRSFFWSVFSRTWTRKNCVFGKFSYSDGLINPFQANLAFLYPLKTSENLWFSHVFRG